LSVNLSSVLPLLNEFLFKSATAVLCGGLIGIERELKRKPAGLRTNILICLGSTYFMLVSILVGTAAPGQAGDPGRIAAQVVTGIGFICAGTIIQSRGHVAGLTTAALLWAVAAVGLLIGAGYLLIAVIGTLLTFLTLTLLGIVEKRILARCRFVDCHVLFKDDSEKTCQQVARLLAAQGNSLDDLHLRKSNGQVSLDIQYCKVHPEHRKLLTDLLMIEGVQEIRPVK